MADTSATVSIDYVLASVKNLLRISDSSEDEYLLQLIIQGITETNIFHVDISGTQTVELTINSARIAELPNDFIDFVRLGVLINGKVVSITENPKLSKVFDETCGIETNPNTETDEHLHYQHYGASGGHGMADYTIDKRKRIIIVSNTLYGHKIYLEYMSSGISSETVLPSYAVPVLREYAIWQRAEYDPQTPMNEKERRGRLYVQQMRRLSEFNNRVTVDEILDGIYSSLRQTIKR